MLFTSATFLWLFLPLVLLFHTPLLRVSLQAANTFLLLASLLFYWWGSEELVLLLAVSVIIDYLAADLASIARRRGRQGIVKVCVGASVVANVGILAWFKYAGFLAETLNDLNSAMGGGSMVVPSVILPIGISFFTFQSMSYTFDVASGKIEPIGDPLRLLLYVSLFPQLIAGPIVRARDVKDQLGDRTAGLEQLTEGFSRFSWGLAKKMLIADAVAPLVDAAYAAEPTMASAWIAAVGYAVQIYFDFSGYSDMAIGLGKMLGFTFPENFDRPYAAATTTDFWRRWHITLSTWFRDYLYIPLGGNRGTQLGTYRNLIIVFLVTGLWHGAAWTFIIWGLWHGAALLIERRAGIRAHHYHPLLRVWTAAVVLGGWILFRSPDLGTAAALFSASVSPSVAVPPAVADAFTPLTAIALFGGAVISILPGQFRPVDLLPKRTRQAEAMRWALYGAALPLVAIRVLSDAYTPFLYFQF
ncbi:MAG: MBOAT family protein [Acidimicrobiales bacterium]|nr:MBOAT family protein [Acidimicrobiales bacterium]